MLLRQLLQLLPPTTIFFDWRRFLIRHIMTNYIAMPGDQETWGYPRRTGRMEMQTTKVPKWCSILIFVLCLTLIKIFLAAQRPIYFPPVDQINAIINNFQKCSALATQKKIPGSQQRMLFKNILAGKAQTPTMNHFITRSLMHGKNRQQMAGMIFCHCQKLVKAEQVENSHLILLSSSVQ